MRSVLSIVRREVQAYFVSPIAYAFLAMFLIVSGTGFMVGIVRYLMRSMMFVDQQAATLRTFLVAGRFGFCNWIRIAMLFSLPGLSMRLFSEERKTGTIELLFTSPVTTLQLVLGKYIGTLCVWGLILFLTTPYVAVLAWKGSPEFGALAVAYLGLLLYGGVILAIGLFASSLTENQFVALLLTYLIVIPFLMVPQFLSFVGPTLGSILSNLSISRAEDRMALGVLDTHYTLLYVAIVFTFLFLCSRVLESGRWR